MPWGLRLWLCLKVAALVLYVADWPIAAAVVYVVWDPWLFWNILVPTGQGFGPVMRRFRTDAREVWLTIDDGPAPSTTPRILDALDRHGARATFFVIGRHVARHPELAAEIVRRGHQLANHTASHSCRSFWGASPSRIASEIDECGDLVARAGVSLSPLMRPPVGIKSPFVHPQLARRGLRLVAWSARGFDSVSRPEQALARIVRQLSPGAIVLLHDGDDRRVQVIEQVLENLGSRGYRAVLPDHEALVA